MPAKDAGHAPSLTQAHAKSTASHAHAAAHKPGAMALAQCEWPAWPPPWPAAGAAAAPGAMARTGTCRLRREVSPLASDRKSTRLNSSHLVISYAVFCLKKKK